MKTYYHSGARHGRLADAQARQTPRLRQIRDAGDSELHIALERAAAALAEKKTTKAERLALRRFSWESGTAAPQRADAPKGTK